MSHTIDGTSAAPAAAWSRLEVRPLRFDVGADARIPRHWHGGRKSVTTFFDNLSIFFPAGERFFVRSVRANADRVKDERLRADVRAFCGQEGAHGREHDRYNDRLRALGYPIDALEQGVERRTRRASKHAPRRTQLAITCALEHFTALMGHMLLDDPRVLEGAHPVMASLWRWHAAEENEHKAVAFDVYRAAGGRYFERVLVMLFASLTFWAKIVEHQVRLMRVDGILFSLREWSCLLGFLFVSPGVMRRLIPFYLRYYLPGFHPNDIDSGHLIDAWRHQNASPSPTIETAA